MKFLKHIPKHAILAAMVFLSAAATFASEQCPAAVQTKQSLTISHHGWTASNEETRFPLVSIRFSDGDPSDKAWLAPDGSKKPTVQYWNLPKSNRGYWISCGYGSTNIILYSQLPKYATKCEVWLDIGYQPPIALKYKCQ